MIGRFLIGCMLLTSLAHTSVPAEQVIRPVNDQAYLPAVLELIDSATNSIDFLALEYHYDPTTKQVQTALARAVERGVAVRGLLENKIDFNQRSLPYLRDLGITVDLDTPKKMLHSKMFVVDGNRVLLGASNLTGNSLDNNHESNVLIGDPFIAGYFAKYIDVLIKDSFSEPDLPSVQSGTVETVVNRQYFDKVLAMFNSAQKRIRVVMYGIKHYPKYPDSKSNQLLDALITAATRGVDVEVVVDLSDYNTTLNEVNKGAKDYLSAGGVAVFDDALDRTTHAKVVLVDDAVVIGSANWGYDALERRNETSVLIRDPAVVESFVEYYDEVKAGGENGPNGR